MVMIAYNYFLKSFKYLLLFLLLLSTNSLLSEENKASSKKEFLYIGIENHRNPYSSFEKKDNLQGIMIDRINMICDTLNVQCKFSTGQIDSLLMDLKSLKLHAVFILDSFILPNLEKIDLTSEICKIEPVFIQKKSNLVRTKTKEFEKTTIGVQKGSLLHIYLLENYNSLAQLKPYIQLENGIFDLVTGRIDALFSDKSFFIGRVLNTTFSNKGSENELVAVKVGEPDFPKTSMSLALRYNDKIRIEKIKNALSKMGNTPLCSNLFKAPIISDHISENNQ